MSKYKIGITEAGDAGIDLSWVEKMPNVNGAIVITKRITPAFMDAVIKNKDKLIVHATITGYGGGVLEPKVPSSSFEFAAVKVLISHGFPKEKIVIRVDPVIPTNKGLAVAYRRVLKTGMEAGFSRYRISVIDMFAHARKRFADAGLPLPYGEHTFAGKEQMRCVDSMVRTAKGYWKSMGHASDLRIEACAEPYLLEPIQSGCISAYDLQLLGLDTNDADEAGFQRKNCLCYSGKTELLNNKCQCSNGCLYCYWQGSKKS